MLVRADLEVEYEKLFTHYNFGLVGWSPLAGGFLTGKYNSGIPKDEVVRANDTSFFFPIELTKQLFYDQHASEKTIEKLKALTAIAEKEGFKLSHLAIAWVLKFKHLDSALIGARTVAQLEDSLKALQFLEKLTPELEEEVNKILDTTPTTRMNFLKWTPFPSARSVAKWWSTVHLSYWMIVNIITCWQDSPTKFTTPSTSSPNPEKPPPTTCLSTNPPSSNVPSLPLSRGFQWCLQRKPSRSKVQATSAHPFHKRIPCPTQQTGLYPYRYLYTALGFDPENEVLRITTLRAGGYHVQ